MSESPDQLERQGCAGCVALIAGLLFVSGLICSFHGAVGQGSVEGADAVCFVIWISGLLFAGIGVWLNKNKR